MSIRILYTTENGTSSDSEKFTKNIYELSEKNNGSFRLKWIFPNQSHKQDSRATVLARELVLPQIESIAKGSVPIFPVVEQIGGSENCSLQIGGISALTLKLEWCGVELKGVPHLESFIDWICTECEAIG